ncbi:MAG: crossover junction endodeoxyribonuclease RuvC [Christensenellales bacterium]
MIILGIDPGLATLGFGVVEFDNSRFSVIQYGAVTTPAGEAFPKRLVEVYKGVQYLAQKYTPDAIAMEELFFNSNAKTAISVGHARGVALLAAAQYNEDKLYEFTPLQVKQAVAGYGRADKNQIQQMVKTLLHLKEIPKPDDAADALAVAICCAHSHNMRSRFKI